MEVSLIKKEKLSSDAYSFYFQRPADFVFLPGQFLRLTLNIENPDERGNSRFFTIASSPTEKDYIMITTRIIQSSFKKTLLNLAINSSVTVVAPMGNFIFKEEETVSHVFLAGGIGITPFRSMIIFAKDKNLSIPITLFTSFRTVEDMVFAKELQKIANHNSWLKLVETITRPEESKTPWSGNTGRIDASLLQTSIFNLPTSIFYISGPPAMVDALKETVLQLGIEEDKIRTEKFTGY